MSCRLFGEANGRSYDRQRISAPSGTAVALTRISLGVSPLNSQMFAALSRRRSRFSGHPFIAVLLEADRQPASRIEHRPLDHGWLRKHQRHRFCSSRFCLSASGSPRNVVDARLSNVSQPRVVAPGSQKTRIETVNPIVVKLIGQSTAVQPCTCFLDGVAVLDAVECDVQSQTLASEYRSPLRTRNTPNRSLLSRTNRSKRLGQG